MNTEKLYWIELCGFDNSREDLGVNKFLGAIPQNVTGIVILFANVEFYNSFSPSAEEKFLDLDDCVYGGRRRFKENDDLLWTNFQLKKLVSILHEKKIKVYATVFDSMETIREGSFSELHGETAQLMADGSRNPCVDVTATLTDGRNYGKFLVSQIKAALKYYDFDGAHFADGISSWRIPLQITDFSSGRLLEFSEFLSDAKKKKSVALLAEKNAVENNSRRVAEKVWNGYRAEWIEFCSRKWAEFYNFLCGELSAAGKECIANIAWVRDPFEALYRYGFDYRLIDFSKLSAIIVNDVNRKVTPESDSCGFKISKDEHKYSNNDAPPVMMAWRAAVGNVKHYTMVPVRDNQEKWDALSSCPNSFNAKAYRRNNCFYFDGEYKRICEGLLYCLSTGVGENEWRFIAEKETASRSAGERPQGFCWLFSETAFGKEVKNYVDNRTPSAFWKLRELQISGLSLYTVTRFEHIYNIDMPLVCFSVNDFSEEERRRLETYNKNPLIIFGNRNPLKRKPNLTLLCTNNDNCYIFNIEREGVLNIGDVKKRAFRKVYKENAECIWIKNLNYKCISRTESRRTAKTLHRIFGLYAASGDVLLNVLSSNGEKTVILDNPSSTEKASDLRLSNKKLSREVIAADGVVAVKTRV